MPTIQTEKNEKGLQIIRTLADQYSDADRQIIIRTTYGGVVAAGIQLATQQAAFGKSAFVVSGRTLRVFVAGIGTRHQGVTVALGYADGSVARRYESFNATVYAAAEGLYRRYIVPHTLEIDTVELHGHSAGGLAVEVLAKLLTRVGFVQSILLCTYGAPAPCHAGHAAAGSFLTRERWMNADDVVPLVPWTSISSGEHVGMYVYGRTTGASAEQAANPSRFVQPAAGLRMESFGVVPGHNPRIIGEPLTRMEAWIGGDTTANDAHSVDQYLATMRAYGRNFPGGVPIRDLHPLPDRAAEVNVEFAAALRQPTQTEEVRAVPTRIRLNSIASDPQGRVVGTAIVGVRDMSFLKINPKRAFRLVRVGNTWNVSIGNQTVIECDSPKIPRTICRRLNSMLRGIGTQNAVNVDALIDGLRAWLDSASQDVATCNPIMRIIT